MKTLGVEIAPSYQPEEAGFMFSESMVAKIQELRKAGWGKRLSQRSWIAPLTLSGATGRLIPRTSVLKRGSIENSGGKKPSFRYCGNHDSDGEETVVPLSWKPWSSRTLCQHSQTWMLGPSFGCRRGITTFTYTPPNVR